MASLRFWFWWHVDDVTWLIYRMGWRAPWKWAYWHYKAAREAWSDRQFRGPIYGFRSWPKTNA